MTAERQNEYDIAYMKMAECMSTLSYAIRNKVGCIIVSKYGQVISQGFNGTPSGADNCCEDVECKSLMNYCIQMNCEHPDEVKNIDLCKDCEYCNLVTKQDVLHAESNAISKCAKWISTTEGGTIYVTLSPCIDCAKLIIQAGIKRVCYKDEYRNINGIDFLKKHNIEVKKIIY